MRFINVPQFRSGDTATFYPKNSDKPRVVTLRNKKMFCGEVYYNVLEDSQRKWYPVSQMRLVR